MVTGNSSSPLSLPITVGSVGPSPLGLARLFLERAQCTQGTWLGERPALPGPMALEGGWCRDSLLTWGFLPDLLALLLMLHQQGTGSLLEVPISALWGCGSLRSVSNCHWVLLGPSPLNPVHPGTSATAPVPRLPQKGHLARHQA